MSDQSRLTLNRRSAISGVTTAGALASTLAALGATTSLSLVGPAHAQGSTGVAMGKGNVVFIPGKSVAAVPCAEWEAPAQNAEANGAPLRIVMGKDSVDKAPATASRYESRVYDFPSGSIRTLTFKKGSGPVLHQVAFETEILLLQGSVTLTPLFGVKGPTVKVKAGDALYFPGGMLRNPKPSEDTVMLLFQVPSTAASPKFAHVAGKDLAEVETVQWMQDGKSVTARNAEEVKSAPANAARFKVKRYAFDGNSIRYATLRKGDKTNLGVTSRNDVLIYVPKGRLRRTEGDETFELVAGDALREKLGNPGYWDVLEDSVFIATDAPVLAAAFAPYMAAPGGTVK